MLNVSIVHPPSNPPRVSVTRRIEIESLAPDTSAQLGYIFCEDHDSK
ncbi:MAG: hypothetical protein ACE5FL_11510 [Myxococcota bacterium]